MRVISLLPSATEIICAIGAGDLLVGRSHECDYPAEVTKLPALTGQRTVATTSADIDAQVRAQLETQQSLYTIDEDAIAALRPDVIVTQDLCEVCSIDLAAVQRLAARLDPSPAIVSLNPTSLEDVFDDVLRVGDALDRAADAKRTMVALREQFFSAKDHVNAYLAGPEVAFLEWLDPIFVGGHWTPQLIEFAGGSHALNPPHAKSRVVTADALVELDPDAIIVCPCGMDLAWTQQALRDTLAAEAWWADMRAVRENRVALVDGHWYFNMPGPRLVDAFRWLVGWLHGIDSLMPADFRWASKDER